MAENVGMSEREQTFQIYFIQCGAILDEILSVSSFINWMITYLQNNAEIPCISVRNKISQFEI